MDTNDNENIKKAGSHEERLKREEETKRGINELIQKKKINNENKNFDKIITKGKSSKPSSGEIVNDNDVLQIRNTINYNHDNFDEKFNNRKNKEKSGKIKNIISQFENNKNLTYNSIGNIKNINEFIQQFNKIYGKIIKQSFQNITYYREIMGDGNCFFRAIIFKYFEFIIFYGRDDLFRDIIYEIDEMFSSDIIKNYVIINEYIVLKKNLIIQILIMVYNILNEENDKEKSYFYFFLAINTCQKFDLSLILYLRYILYKYIKNNEEKIFSKNSPVKIGNLLPEKYDDNGIFLFDKFYKEYLLIMYTFAEKLVIYIIPFIFGIPLNIFFYESNEENKNQKFEHNFEKVDFNEQINLIYRNNHYELVYTETEIQKYKELYKRSIIIKKIEKKVDINCIKCKNPIENKENNTGLCDNCLLEFLKKQTIKKIKRQSKINFSELKFEIEGEKYRFDELLDIIIKSSITNKPIDKESFINEINEEFCILDKDLISDNEKKITIPCGCSFHDINCLKSFYNNEYFNENLICSFCQYNYNFDEICSIFEKICEKYCCLCGNQSEKLNKLKYSYKFEKEKKINHNLCDNCKLTQKQYDNFICKCCNFQHVYYQ